MLIKQINDINNTQKQSMDSSRRCFPPCRTQLIMEFEYVRVQVHITAFTFQMWFYRDTVSRAQHFLVIYI